MTADLSPLRLLLVTLAGWVIRLSLAKTLPGGHWLICWF